MEERVILCVDMDYFYAQVEERDNPSLRGNPLLVCVYSGRTDTSGVVSTANYRARELGIKSGMPIYQAMRILRNEQTTRLFPMRMDYYREVSGRIMKILKEESDILEQVSIDEAYLDISRRSHNNFELGKAVAINVKNRIKEEEKLTCSVGLGPNKLIAKMAADYQKPDGLTVIPPEAVTDFISPMGVSKLFRVGKKAESKFFGEGIKTIRDIRSVKLEKLVQMFGNTMGKYYWNASRGIDTTPVERREGHGQISRISTLKTDTFDFADMEPKFNELVSEAIEEMKENELKCRTVSTILILKNLQTHTKSKTLEEPTNSQDEIREVSISLMKSLLKEQKLEARRIGIRLNHLSKQKKQHDLETFMEPTALRGELQRN
jgi:DNA polymerase IV (DinB-like DNA polymerase)